MFDPVSVTRNLLALTETDRGQIRIYEDLAISLRDAPFRIELTPESEAASLLRRYGYQQGIITASEMLGRDVGLFVVENGPGHSVVLQSASMEAVAKLVPPPGATRQLYKFRPGHYMPLEIPDLDRDIARAVDAVYDKGIAAATDVPPIAKR